MVKMKGYILNVKLNDMEYEISRTLVVPDCLTFAELSYQLRKIFDLTGFNPAEFIFPGLNLPLNENAEIRYEDSQSFEITVNDYFNLFKKCTWRYWSKNLHFNIKIKKTNNAKEHSYVESYTGKYNPLDYRDVYDMDYLIHTGDVEEFTVFDIDDVNCRLMKM